MRPEDVKRAWFKRRVPEAKLEEDILEAIKREVSPLPLPKAAEDFSQKQSKALLYKKLPGDEIWWFTTPENHAAVLSGCEGYVLVRDGAVIDVVTTWIS